MYPWHREKGDDLRRRLGTFRMSRAETSKEQELGKIAKDQDVYSPIFQSSLASASIDFTKLSKASAEVAPLLQRMQEFSLQVMGSWYQWTNKIHCVRLEPAIPGEGMCTGWVSTLDIQKR